jgi:deazaflavin-dependent oxidoreductase (nitroreductase family)
MAENNSPRNIKPARIERVFNAMVGRLTRLGISLWGARLLRVRGRTTGQWRSTPVNLLSYESDRYLVAPRGETQWVRNLRVAGGGELKLGRRVEPFTATELANEQKPPVLRAYQKQWGFQVDKFFEGVGPDASPEALLQVAGDYPVFRLAADGS